MPRAAQHTKLALSASLPSNYRLRFQDERSISIAFLLVYQGARPVSARTQARTRVDFVLVDIFYIHHQPVCLRRSYKNPRRLIQSQSLIYLPLSYYGKMKLDFDQLK